MGNSLGGTAMPDRKLTSWRSWEHGESPASQEMQRYANQLLREFGRSDLSMGVQAAARDAARKLRLSSKDALGRLIAEAGSLELLEQSVKKASRHLRRKRNKQKRRAAEHGNRRSSVPLSNTYVKFVEGGAPGLGGVRKPIQVGIKKS